MYVATATDRPLAEAASAMQGSTTTSGDLSLWRRWGSAKKESAEIYERAMRRLQSNKKDTVVFEDAFHAIQTAKAAAGFRVAAVYDASEEAHQEEIRGLADYYIRSFEEMFETRELEDRLPATEGPSGPSGPGGLLCQRVRISASRAASDAVSVLAASSSAVRKLPLPRSAARCSPGGRRSSRRRRPGQRRGGVRLHGGEHTAQHRQHTARAGDERHPPLPPVTHQTRAPIGDEILRTGEQHRRVLRRRARSMAVSLRASWLAGSGLSTPCSCPSDPSRARPPPRFTRRMDGVNRSSSARTCPSRQDLRPPLPGSAPPDDGGDGADPQARNFSASGVPVFSTVWRR